MLIGIGMLQVVDGRVELIFCWWGDFALEEAGHTLVVGLEETDSSPIIPLDSVADFCGWDTGSAKAQVGGASDGNAHSCSHQATDPRVGEVPLLS